MAWCRHALCALGLVATILASAAAAAATTAMAGASILRRCHGFHGAQGRQNIIVRRGLTLPVSCARVAITVHWFMRRTLRRSARPLRITVIGHTSASCRCLHRKERDRWTVNGWLISTVPWLARRTLRRSARPLCVTVLGHYGGCLSVSRISLR